MAVAAAGNSTFQQIELAVLQWVHNGMLTKANVITLIENGLHLTWELIKVELLLLLALLVVKIYTNVGIVNFKTCKYFISFPSWSDRLNQQEMNNTLREMSELDLKVTKFVVTLVHDPKLKFITTYFFFCGRGIKIPNQ
jgi:hypothetical protein